MYHGTSMSEGLLQTASNDILWSVAVKMKYLCSKNGGTIAGELDYG